MGYAEQRLRRLVGRAIHEQQMISEGDHILVAVSGGKDSLALLWLLREKIRRAPISFRLTAVHVDPGFGSDSAGQMERFFVEQDLPFSLLRSQIGPQAHGPENRENPCFLCSRLRRKLLFQKAAELGCNKIAFGHHKDDLIETFFLNVFYGGAISTMLPKQVFFGGRLIAIRPLYLAEEDLLRRFSRSMSWPRIDLGCPTAGRSRREDVKQMLLPLYRANRKVRGNIFHALQNVRTEYLP